MTSYGGLRAVAPQTNPLGIPIIMCLLSFDFRFHLHDARVHAMQSTWHMRHACVALLATRPTQSSPPEVHVHACHNTTFEMAILEIAFSVSRNLH